VSGITWIIYVAFIVATIAAWWMVFTKAGEAGWKSIIPIYNIIVILKIVGRDWWCPRKLPAYRREDALSTVR
jgi:hypothetical protein